MKGWIKAAAVAAAVAATPIVAQETLGSSGGPPPGRGGGMGMMRMADANGDGVVTRDEWVAATDARFARMDRNGDGVLDESERPGRRGLPPGADGAGPPPGGPGPGGKITREQFRQQAMRRFDRLDSNHDGKVDGNEMAAAATLMRARRAGGGEGGDMPPLPPGE